MIFFKELLICLFSFLVIDFVSSFADKKINDLSSLPVKINSEVYNHGYLPLIKSREFWGGRKYNLITNSLGLRDSEKKHIQKNTDKLRVLIAGDSFSEAPRL